LLSRLEDGYWGMEAGKVKARGEWLRGSEAADWVKRMEQRLEPLDATS
jgi:hypothetical protein